MHRRCCDFRRVLTLTLACSVLASASLVAAPVKKKVCASSASVPHRLKKQRKIVKTDSKPLDNPVRIVLDPGHGGEDYGTYSVTKPRLHEKYLTLMTALMVRDALYKMGYHAVVLTRNKDEVVSLQDRVAFAGRQQATLFVSIHYNSAPAVTANGIEVFYYDPGEKSSRTAPSAKLAQALLKHTQANTEAKSRGVKKGHYVVIKETTMPAALVEGGFLTNAAELKKLRDPAYVRTYANGIAEGIDDYLRSIGLAATAKAVE